MNNLTKPVIISQDDPWQIIMHLKVQTDALFLGAGGKQCTRPLKRISQCERFGLERHLARFDL